MSIGDTLAILGAPAIGGMYTAGFTATVYAAQGRPINEVMDHANRGGLFGTLALLPASILGFIVELALTS